MEISKNNKEPHFHLREGLFFLTSFLIFCLPKLLQAQQEKEKELITFSGKVMEAARHKGIPDVQVISRKNLVGSFSEQNGDFEVLVTPGDSLLITSTGYASLHVAITDSLLSLDHVPVFYMAADTIQMHEVIIRGYPNYQILKQRIAHMKPQDRPFNVVDYMKEHPLLYLQPSSGTSMTGPVQLLYNLLNSEAVLQRQLIRNRRRYNKNMIKLGRIQDTIPAIPDYMRELKR
ncbi:MAG: hypothetical protein JXR71_10195 [Bacteroidales bacterium]|nr:hypothetical protein [Bacteroidales bacterium]